MHNPNSILESLGKYIKFKTRISQRMMLHANVNKSGGETPEVRLNLPVNFRLTGAKQNQPALKKKREKTHFPFNISPLRCFTSLNHQQTTLKRESKCKSRVNTKASGLPCVFSTAHPPPHVGTKGIPTSLARCFLTVKTRCHYHVKSKMSFIPSQRAFPPSSAGMCRLLCGRLVCWSVGRSPPRQRAGQSTLVRQGFFFCFLVFT